MIGMPRPRVHSIWLGAAPTWNYKRPQSKGFLGLFDLVYSTPGTWIAVPFHCTSAFTSFHRFLPSILPHLLPVLCIMSPSLSVLQFQISALCVPHTRKTKSPWSRSFGASLRFACTSRKCVARRTNEGSSKGDHLNWTISMRSSRLSGSSSSGQLATRALSHSP